LKKQHQGSSKKVSMNEELRALTKHVKEKAYAAFIDVLGYKEIIVGDYIKSEEQRLKYLLNIWENLGPMIAQSTKDFPDVEKYLFSDSLILISDHLEPLIVGITDIYVNSYVYYESIPEAWMPMIRGGICYDWVINFKDETLSDKLRKYQDSFRNPAGPAVAKAYLLAEKSGFKGMRILIPENLKLDFTMNAKHASYDIPWWKCLNDGMDPSRVLNSHLWQMDFNKDKAEPHFRATLDLMTK
jgi:hypothetical protein